MTSAGHRADLPALVRLPDPDPTSISLQPPDDLLLCERLKSATGSFNDRGSFHSEAALVSRLIYLMGRKLRHDIGLSYLKKTNAALRKYLSLNINKALETFRLSLTSTVRVPGPDESDTLLRKLRSLCLILTKITRSALESARFFFDRLKRGETAWMALLPYSVLSKVWSQAGRLSLRASELYSTLLPFGTAWSSPNLRTQAHYEFPVRVEEWIERELPEEKDYSLETDKADSVRDKLYEIADELPQKNPTDDNILRKEESKEASSVSGCYSKRSNIIRDIDSGIALSRNDLRVMNDIDSPIYKQIRENPSQYCEHRFSNVVDGESLVRFLRQEDIFRQRNSSKSLSSHIGFMQWQTLKNILLNTSGKLKNNLFCKKTLKQLQHKWKERCK